jgi:hypothetical protein
LLPALKIGDSAWKLKKEMFPAVCISFFALDFGSELLFPTIDIIFTAVRFPKRDLIRLLDDLQGLGFFQLRKQDEDEDKLIFHEKCMVLG